jgi:teichuronic acid biosynthesis glycosyltransferase TuaG
MSKVSVIVTTSNRKDYLRETINSILDQTYQNFELIVVDNYSNYDFLAFIASFKNDKIVAFQNHDDRIIAVNRNFGIEHTTGELIAFCDDDDIWHKRKLELQVKYLQQRPSVILIATLAKKFGESTSFFGENFGIMFRKHKLDYDSIVKANPFVLSSIMVRKENALKINGFRELKELVAIEDFDFCFRLLNQGDFCIIRKILVFYRFHAKNISGTRRNEKYLNFLKINNICQVTKSEKRIKHSFFIIMAKNLLHQLLIIWFLIIELISKIKIFNQILLKCSNQHNSL